MSQGTARSCPLTVTCPSPKIRERVRAGITRAETKAALVAALAERDEYMRQRDIAMTERDEAIQERDYAIAGSFDRLPSALQLALAERNTYHDQRDQAFHELDEVTGERNQLKVEVERLKRQIIVLGSSRSREKTATVLDDFRSGQPNRTIATPARGTAQGMSKIR